MLNSLRALLNSRQKEDFSTLYSAAPDSFAERFPEIPKPESALSPELLAARWSSHDLYGEDMPRVAADLLECGYDTPSLRRLAGLIQVESSANVEDLVGRMFRELGTSYPMAQRDAKLFFTRQLAREAIAGMRNVWATAKHIEITIWGWQAENDDLATLFQLNDEIDWRFNDRRPLSELTAEVINTLARIAAPTEREHLQRD